MLSYRVGGIINHFYTRSEKPVILNVAVEIQLMVELCCLTAFTTLSNSCFLLRKPGLPSLAAEVS